MGYATLLYYALAVGVLEGLYFAFMALGLNIVFGVVRMINVAHGDLVMLGAYVAFMLFVDFRVNALYTFVLLFPVFFGLGIAIYYILVPRLEKSSDPEINSFIAFFGLSLFIESAATIAFGVSPTSLPASATVRGARSLAGYGVPNVLMVGAAASVVILALIFYYLEFTGLGRAARALMQNKEQAMALGVNVRLATLFAFALGFALAGMAGVFEPYVFGYIYPSYGGFLTVLAFTVVIIGALGNPLSSIIGGLVFGVVYQILSVYIPSLAYAISFLLLLVIIVVKPGGVLGGAQREV